MTDLPMQLSDYQYELPKELIAQDPVEPRDSSRLLVLHASSGEMEHRRFTDLPEYLNPGDILVGNDSRVVPARILGHKATGGRVEVLLLRPQPAGDWEALVFPGKRVPPGTLVHADGGSLDLVIGERTEFGGRLVSLHSDLPLEEALLRAGQMPLPPYIHTRLSDPERYQTIYSREMGSAAAPTAGLHFTPRLLEDLHRKGIPLYRITLHIGLDTFRPIKVENLEAHTMHSEAYEVPEQAAEAIRDAGGRVVAVGTTSVRALESSALGHHQVRPGRDSTRLFIRPGFRFQAVDALVTNFHLPGSTLLVMVSALAGRETILKAYREAVEQRYRFYSFGDAMLILP
ncbi:MAG TPA: tRNA preQ1(34) S-adenosylmethionine ribosyltransferase-isomerase QueA [Armatimonadota bacterium]